MSASYDLVVRARSAVTAKGILACDVGVKNGTIAAIDSHLDGPIFQLLDDQVLLPGLVDTHVHVNEPGRTHWEGFTSATRAAAAGGVTTLLDMPLNCIPPTTDVAALRVKQTAAQGHCYVDVGFWGGAVPGNLRELSELHRAGVFGFKCFLSDSGVAEFPPLSESELTEVMSAIARIDGLLIVHAEDARLFNHSARSGYRSFLEARPSASEDSAVERVVTLSRRTKCRCHIVHLSSADAIRFLAGSPVSAETCPHYLFFEAEEVADGATEFKCCPPIRGSANRDALWQGLRNGAIDFVASDHSPAPAELKHTGDFGTAWGGISSIQLSLPAVWTEARRRGFGLVDVARWMSTAPAALVGLSRKGVIDIGHDADFCVLAPEETFLVNGEALHHKHPLTPYSGHRLSGVVRSSWLRGERIDIDGPPSGLLLSRGTS